MGSTGIPSFSDCLVLLDIAARIVYRSRCQVLLDTEVERMITRDDIRKADDSRKRRIAATDLQAECLRRTLDQLDPYRGLRAALASRDRTRGWLA